METNTVKEGEAMDERLHNTNTIFGRENMKVYWATEPLKQVHTTLLFNLVQDYNDLPAVEIHEQVAKIKALRSEEKERKEAGKVWEDFHKLRM